MPRTTYLVALDADLGPTKTDVSTVITALAFTDKSDAEIEAASATA